MFYMEGFFFPPPHLMRGKLISAAYLVFFQAWNCLKEHSVALSSCYKELNVSCLHLGPRDIAHLSECQLDTYNVRVAQGDIPKS